jgi:hypothetical protein
MLSEENSASERSFQENPTRKLHNVEDFIDNLPMIQRLLRDNETFEHDIILLKIDLQKHQNIILEKTREIDAKTVDLKIKTNHLESSEIRLQDAKARNEILEKQREALEKQLKEKDEKMADLTLELRLEQERLKFKDLQIEERNKRIEEDKRLLEEQEHQALPNGVFSLIAAILLSFGVNLVPITPSLGWGMIFVACLAQLKPFLRIPARPSSPPQELRRSTLNDG